MLVKTFEYIEGVPAGTYLPPEVPSFDETEVAALAGILNRLLYGPSEIRKRLQQLGVTVVPSNFYSEVPTVEEVEAAQPKDTLAQFQDIFDLKRMTGFVEELVEAADEFSPPKTSSQPGEFMWENGAFGYSDAMAYYSILRVKKPKVVVEVGSGWSTLVARDALAANGFGRIICVEPYPGEVLKSLGDQVEVIPKRVQDLPSDFFNSLLGENDVLFIDSTHTVKHDSDCVHLFLRHLPSISQKIWVHVHDIRLPFQFPVEMARDSQIYWTEQYLLYAYLLDNQRCKTLFSSCYLNSAAPESLRALMHGRELPGGGSVWFQQEPRIL